MEPSEVTSLVTGAIGCFLIVLASHPSLFTIFNIASSRVQHGHDENSELYEDEDGTATEETQQAFSDKLPKVLILVTSSLGLLFSLALAVFGSTRPRSSLIFERWLAFGAWVRILALPKQCSADSSSRSSCWFRLQVSF